MEDEEAAVGAAAQDHPSPVQARELGQPFLQGLVAVADVEVADVPRQAVHAVAAHSQGAAVVDEDDAVAQQVEVVSEGAEPFGVIGGRR